MNLLLPLLLAVSVPQQESDTSLLQYEVNGLRVIHQRRPASSEVISIQLYLLGGSRNVNAEQAGVEQLILEAAAFGTERFPGDESRRALARTGAALGASASYDYSVYEFDALKQDFDSAWVVFTDRLMRPTLDSASVEVVRQRMLGRVARRRVSPEDFAWSLADSLSYDGHPYANPPGGTERSLKALTREGVRQYHTEQFVTSRMVLVVAGDLSRERIERALGESLGTLPRGEYKWVLPEPVTPTTRSLAVAGRSVRTNYIVATAFGPGRGTEEFHAFRSGMGLFGSVFSNLVREEAQLSYAAGVSVVENGLPLARLHVSTTNPDSVMRIVKNIFDFFAGDARINYPRAWIREQTENVHRGYLAAIETADGQGHALFDAFLYQGDPRMAARAGDVMKRLTIFDMRRAIRRYAKCLQFAYVGDTTSVPREVMLGKDPKC